MMDNCSKFDSLKRDREKRIDLFKKMLLKDKVSFLFLIVSDEAQCVEAINSTLLNPATFIHCIFDIRFSGSQDLFDHEVKLSDACLLLKQYFLLPCFGYCKHTYQSQKKLNPLRVLLFRVYDEMTTEEAELLCSLFPPVLSNASNNSVAIELLLMRLVLAKRISLNDMSFLNLGLQRIMRRDLCKLMSNEIDKYPLAQTLVPTKILSRDEYYDMSSYPSGICVIFNQKNFWKEESHSLRSLVHNVKLDKRIGTDVDRDFISETFQFFGFKIKVFESRTHMQIMRDLEDISREDMFGCLVVCILSHGTQGKPFLYPPLSLPVIFFVSVPASQFFLTYFYLFKYFNRKSLVFISKRFISKSIYK
ncbi:hypothetical protein QYM36_008113 [Artemia franciscana]|uniref:Caspase-8 n=1 Tax=Artemia franciscana TaxID=6661 RepID=A0AA88LEE9_ARTSF|nr:hypothetical protein QYM36_008113 [Artemia franciscana]